MLSEGWIDVSIELSADTLVWPGDPSFRRELAATHDEEDVEVATLRMSAHTGTHVDAPAHYLAEGPRIADLPLDALMGPCFVHDLGGREVITAADIDSLGLNEGERVLLRTDNSLKRSLHQTDFDYDFVALDLAAAEILASIGVRCVGIDYLSVGRGSTEQVAAVHRTLLGSGVWIIESLDLHRVEPGAYEMICLPLSIPRGEAAPARALLKARGEKDDGEIDFIDDAAMWASKTG